MLLYKLRIAFDKVSKKKVVIFSTVNFNKTIYTEYISSDVSIVNSFIGIDNETPEETAKRFRHIHPNHFDSIIETTEEKEKDESLIILHFTFLMSMFL